VAAASSNRLATASSNRREVSTLPRLRTKVSALDAFCGPRSHVRRGEPPEKRPFSSVTRATADNYPSKRDLAAKLLNRLSPTNGLDYSQPRRKRVLTKLTTIAVVTASLAIMSASKAEASFIAYVCDDVNCTGGGDTIVTDNGGGDLAPGVTGFILVSTTAGGLNIVVNESQSKPVLGSATNPEMDINFTATCITGLCSGGTVYLYASDTDFLSGGAVNGTFGGTQAGAGGAVQFGISGGDSNTNLDLSPQVLSPVITTTPFSGSLGFAGNTTSPFSLTLLAKITLNGPGSTTGDFNVAALVPEPTGLVLFGTGLTALAMVVRRRRARSSSTK
jgi:hypothetical protein